jgi:hypothetical protein
MGSPSCDVQDVPPTWLPNHFDHRGSKVQLNQSPDCEPPNYAQNRLGGSIATLWPHQEEHLISQGENPFPLPQLTLERVPNIMVIPMVLHIVEFVNGLP